MKQQQQNEIEDRQNSKKEAATEIWISELPLNDFGSFH
jgi:hypothetical protein